jgi:hypothetical protein
MKPNKPQLPFQVPDGYFERLTEDITQRAKTSKESFNNSTPFTVPSAYFDNLPNAILEKAKGKTRKTHYPIYWSVAASITLLIASSIWYFQTNNTSSIDTLANVPTMQLEKYLALQNTADIEFLVENDQTIVPDSLAQVINQEALPLNNKEIDKVLDDNPELELLLN